MRLNDIGGAGGGDQRDGATISHRRRRIANEKNIAEIIGVHRRLQGIAIRRRNRPHHRQARRVHRDVETTVLVDSSFYQGLDIFFYRCVTAHSGAADFFGELL